MSFETRKKANRSKSGYNGFTGYLLPVSTFNFSKKMYKLMNEECLSNLPLLDTSPASFYRIVHG
ncbi:MAG: hypothetical protein JRI33_06435 [Deltaproteobacteria bacterium]|nr:hypothetical protein [Deltaproteobacteria bacterium]